MLVARRDPFHPGAHDAAAGPRPGVPRPNRLMTALQVAGSLLAIPVGLASAYSIYRANFSVEITCQSLRANIISLIDKQIDATTRRMLVRRDVEAFEMSCGGFDPDAEAAFKRLLATEKTLAPAVAVAPRAPEAQPRPAVRKAEPRPTVTVKQPPANDPSASAESEPVRRDAVTSDDKWLAAVRQALVTHNPEPAPSVDAVVPRAVNPTPAIPPVPRETGAVNEALPPPAAARALPPATSITTTIAPRSTDDHPVPPAPIPDAAPAPDQANAAKPESHGSRFGAWAAQIPLLGTVVDAVGGGSR